MATNVIENGARANVLSSNTLPRWASAACIAGSAAASGLIFALAGWNTPLFAILAALLYLAAWTILNAAVRGGRHGSNAFWATLVWVAFFLALVPLVSIIWTVVSNGVRGLTTFGFLGSDMTGITGVQDQAAAAGQAGVLGGIQHALVGSFQRGECPDQPPGRVRHDRRAAGVHVGIRATRREFDVADPFQAAGETDSPVEILATALPDAAIGGGD